ncbi:unnamed protein product [Rotaria sp. Silwood1]|nr:unnamed protein product [Rotaria sp. Silwood1]
MARLLRSKDIRECRSKEELYIQPTESSRLSQCELLIIDEAAAIPLPLVKQLLTGANYLIFLSSTINGYEGTGRSLSLKLLEQLRKQSAVLTTATKTTTNNRTLSELELNEPIRYGIDDPIELWLNNLLCLDCCQDPSKFNKATSSGCPSLESCSLYCISRDTLFSYNESSEKFLRRLMYLFVSSHYKNSPNDLQMLSDAPGHDIYCLLGPIIDSNQLPDILCAIQVCYEGDLSKDVVARQLTRGQRNSGDLIPWTIAQTYQDYTFGKMSGVRIVRLATHPDYQRMGYGTKAIQLLEKYFQGHIVNIDEYNNQESASSPTPDQVEIIDDEDLPLLNEKLYPRRGLPPLLEKLNERRLKHSIDYLGVSYGLSADLLKFWKKNQFLPIYLRQTASELTGEYSCIMLKTIHQSGQAPWLFSYYQDFRRRLLSLLGFQFRIFTPGMVLNLIQQAVYPEIKEEFTVSLIEQNFTDYDLRRLESYTRNLVDYHLILDLIPTLAKLFYLNRLPIQLTVVQMALLSGIGLQYKTIEQLESELNLSQSQLLALFNKLIKKIIDLINSVQENEIGKTFVNSLDTANMQPLDKSLRQELLINSVQENEIGKTFVNSLDTANMQPLDKSLRQELTSHGFEDKNVLVIGIGNSGGDLVVELGRVAKQVYLSTRRGTWVLNRVGPNGWPFDLLMSNEIISAVQKYFPSLTNWLMERDMNQKFNHEIYGLKPNHRPLEQHPFINDDLANRILCGSVIIKPDVKEFTADGHGVVFSDGSKVDHIDCILMATGFNIAFPYLDEKILTVKDNRIRLYKYVWPSHMTHPTLAVMGLIQPWGAINPITELQARWVVRVFNGELKLSSCLKMDEDIDEKIHQMSQRYVASSRHTVQVDYLDYCNEIAKQVGCRPNILNFLIKDFKLGWHLLFGSCTPYRYRLEGPNQWDGARQAILTQNERVKYPLRVSRKQEQNQQKKFAINWTPMFSIVFFILIFFIIFQCFM